MLNGFLCLSLIQPLTERHEDLPALCLEYPTKTLAYILPKLETQNIIYIHTYTHTTNGKQLISNP